MNRKIFVITPTPDFFKPFQTEGVIGQLLQGKRGVSEITLEIVALRDYGVGNYKQIDDSPYGGGPGVVLRGDCLEAALLRGVLGDKESELCHQRVKELLYVIAPGPRGSTWNHRSAKLFAEKLVSKAFDKTIVFICGRYEGIDERFLEKYVDEHISIGDYILSGGDLAVMAILDSTLRYISGTLNHKDGANYESFENSSLESPVYTRPRSLFGKEVPHTLSSGNHKLIKEFHEKESKELTLKCRPDLIREENEKK